MIDLTTLRGEDDRLALLEGQPVPAQIAREWAEVVRTWRRVVTDPVDGHLLEYNDSPNVTIGWLAPCNALTCGFTSRGAPTAE